jgi:hypothetical protein
MRWRDRLGRWLRTPVNEYVLIVLVLVLLMVYAVRVFGHS